MGYEVGYDRSRNRDVGYGVPAKCDHPGCQHDIDRGLGYICGGDFFGGDEGCGLFFCGNHLRMTSRGQLCERCAKKKEPFEPSPDTEEWIRHKLTHESWQQWRDENAEEVERLTKKLENEQ